MPIIRWTRFLQLTATLTAAICITTQAIAANPSTKPVEVSEPHDALNAACWLQTSLQRVFPRTAPSSAQLSLLAVRNGRLDFQVCVRNQRPGVLYVHCAITGADDLKPLVRWVGLVPVRHFTVGTKASELDGIGDIPGLVPDPLYPTSDGRLGPFETRSFWITLKVPAGAKPGQHDLNAHLELRSAPTAKPTQADLPVDLTISQFVVQPRKDFPVTHWWRGEATWDYYHTGMFDQRWWKITHDQLEDMLAHGSNVIYVPSLFNLRPIFKRPCQMLIVTEPTPGHYEFDWSRVKKFIDMTHQIGFKQFEWPHLWIYWGVKNPIRVYTQNAAGQYSLLWPADTDGFSDTYINFLKQYLPSFHDFLQKENLLDCSYFHLSDEPGASDIGRYKHARAILHQLAPWMKTMDALSNIRYGTEHVTDMPIPQIGSALKFVKAGIPHWVYFCCSPKGAYLNRFADTPLPKIRMAGWLFYHFGAKGFLHWGFNYWHKLESEQIVDPFNDLTADDWPGIPAGDPFEIYPGPDGKPIDSLRWEVFADSLQDYAILQTAGVSPDDPVFSPLKSYANFPKKQQWIQQTLHRILSEQPKPSGKQATLGN